MKSYAVLSVDDLLKALGNQESMQLDLNKKINFTVQGYSEQMFKTWTDGGKWLLVSNCMVPRDDKPNKPEGVGYLYASNREIKEFIDTYPHNVGTFFVIADYTIVLDIARANPSRDIRLVLC